MTYNLLVSLSFSSVRNDGRPFVFVIFLPQTLTVFRRRVKNRDMTDLFAVGKPEYLSREPFWTLNKILN
jgi:hypothetical protein